MQGHGVILEIKIITKCACPCILKSMKTKIMHCLKLLSKIKRLWNNYRVLLVLQLLS